MNFNPTPINSPLTTRPVTLDHALANLCEVFGLGSLVAVPRGVAPDAAPAPLLTEANSDDYLRRLATSSIAVKLGGLSGLTAIRFADRYGLDEFLARNVSCQETLITGHADGATIWLRATTAFRPSLDLPQLHVRMTGNVLVFCRGDFQARDEFLNLADIKGVDLFALDWGPDPDGQVAVWLASLSFGKFVRQTQRGHFLPKREAWRDYLLRRLKTTTAFDRATGRFHRRLNEEVWQPLDEQQLTSEVRQLVTTAPVPGTLAHSWCNDEWVIGMVAYLRRVLVGEVPFAVNHLRAFARAALTVSPGRDVTVGEVYCEFTRFCRERNLPLISQRSFQKLIAKVLHEPPWGRDKSKSVRRATGAQNGFRGVCLRSSVRQSLQP